jgi:hypothetical protein
VRKVRKTVNWLEIKDEFEHAGKSMRLLAQEYGVSEGAIRYRAKAENWTRQRAAVETRKVIFAAPARTIEVATRADIDDLVDKGNALAARMLDELDATTTREGELKEMIGQACDGDDQDQKRDAMMRAVSLPSRAMTLRNLSAVVKTLAEAKAPKGKKAAAQEAAMLTTSGGIDDLLSRIPGRPN